MLVFSREHILSLLSLVFDSNDNEMIIVKIIEYSALMPKNTYVNVLIFNFIILQIYTYEKEEKNDYYETSDHHTK